MNTGNAELSSPPSISSRSHRISAASTLSDLGSDIFSSYDSRRSTISSVVSVSDIGSGSPSSSPLTRNRENAKLLQAERIQRRRAESVNSVATSGSRNTEDDHDGSPLLRRRTRAASTKKYQPANPQAALAATEPPHENLLTKMAFAEQQRWITVQQKTFTKWLNTKIETRGLEVVDLVKDLSDGVCAYPYPRFLLFRLNMHASYHDDPRLTSHLVNRLCLFTCLSVCPKSHSDDTPPNPNCECSASKM